MKKFIFSEAWVHSWHVFGAVLFAFSQAWSGVILFAAVSIWVRLYYSTQKSLIEILDTGRTMLDVNKDLLDLTVVMADEITELREQNLELRRSAGRLN